jgi:hypothetical protein
MNDYYAITMESAEGQTSGSIYFRVTVRVKRGGSFEDYEVKAIVDTGSDSSGITDRLAKQAGLVSNRFKKMASTQGKFLAPVHTVDVIFPKGKIFENVEVTEGYGGYNDYDFIIGMDIITMGDMALTYDKEKNLRVFSYRTPPAGKPVDYEYERIMQHKQAENT